MENFNKKQIENRIKVIRMMLERETNKFYGSNSEFCQGYNSGASYCHENEISFLELLLKGIEYENK